MIKITLPSNFDKTNKDFFLDYKRDFKKKLIEKSNELISKRQYVEGYFYWKVAQKLEVVLYGNIEELQNINIFFQNLFAFSKKELTALKDSFFEPQYTDFRNKYGYWFGEVTNIKVCPYCNINFIYNFKLLSKGKTKTTFELDHFFSKSQFPWLALSFYNLIPCCGNCNLFKFKEEFNSHSNIYPYREKSEFEFKIQPKSKLALEEFYKESLPEWKNLESFYKSNKEKLKRIKDKKHGLSLTSNQEKLKAEKNDKEKIYKEALEKVINDSQGLNCFYNIKNFDIILTPQPLNKKDEGNVKAFYIEERYQEHKDYAYEIFQRTQLCSEAYINSIYSDESYSTIFSDREEIKRLAIGNYYQEEDMGKRPLSKLTRDIAKQFGLY